MYKEVGVAADRRREMGVPRECEPEMPLHLRTVARKHQTAKKHPVDRPFEFSPPREFRPCLEEGRRVATAGGTGTAQEFSGRRLELLDLLQSGLLVNPEEESVASTGQVLGHRRVREQHELLD